jgi:hypothetical protein
MAEHSLATYLNDHLAGSVAAVELLELIDQMHVGDDKVAFVFELRAEIESDRGELEALMARLQIAVSRTRKAAAWFSEKFTEFKLRLDSREDGALRRLEVWEALSLGIEGKRLLWVSLATAAESRPDLAGPDYNHLQHRAKEQRRNVESMRIKAARAALAVSPMNSP